MSKSINFVLRKNKLNEKITVENAMDRNYLNNLLNHDEGYNIFKNIRCSPAYWQNKKKEILAMIRQLGQPNLFLTLSAAESKWPELLVLLMKNIENITISEEEALELPYNKIAELISKDPVTCSRYFDLRINKLIHIMLFKPGGPFGKNRIKDYYYRIEFQHRGSPHIHMVLWIDGAPIYNNFNSEECIKFIDKFITCNDKNLLTDLQRHLHRSTCKIRSKSGIKCRFNIPIPIMQKTTFLDPFENINKKDKKIHLDNYAKIKYYLNNCFANKSFLNYDEILRN
jgi:hypothetical protein